MFCKQRRLSENKPYDAQFLRKSDKVYACWWCMRAPKVSARRTKTRELKF